MERSRIHLASISPGVEAFFLVPHLWLLYTFSFDLRLIPMNLFAIIRRILLQRAGEAA